MTSTTVRSVRRFDRTLRAVMWMDAFLSVAFVAVGIFASPIVATLGVPPSIRLGVGIATMVSAVLLAAFGAITAVALMVRMSDGDYFLPPQLRLPLPDGMRPTPWPEPARPDPGAAAGVTHPSPGPAVRSSPRRRPRSAG